MAAYKIPVLHVISLKDKIVPPTENTFPLIEAYTKLGGPATVYSMSRGEQTLEGHHFPIEHPERWADFIQEHSYPVQPVLGRERYLEPNRGVGTALSKFQNKKEGTVAFLGGSITHNPGWRNKTEQYLRERFPDTKFTFHRGRNSFAGQYAPRVSVWPRRSGTRYSRSAFCGKRGE